MKRFGYSLTDFLEGWRGLLKHIEKIQVWLKLDGNNVSFTYTSAYIYGNTTYRSYHGCHRY